MTVTVNVTTDPISVTVDDAPIVISSDETPALGGGSGFAPDPSGQPDDKWLKTTGGVYTFVDAPSGTTTPSDGTPQSVAQNGAAGVSTAFSRADHVHSGAAFGHNHAGVYAPDGHNHDTAYLQPTEIIAGTNVSVDLATTPGSAIIAAAGSDDHTHSAYTPTTRQVIAGAGLTGGGSLASDRTVAIGAGAGITVAADSISINRTTVDTWYSLAGHNHSGVYATAAQGATADAALPAAGGTVTGNLEVNGDLTQAAEAVIVEDSTYPGILRMAKVTAAQMAGLSGSEDANTFYAVVG